MTKVFATLSYLTIAYFALFWPVLKSDTILESGNDARRFGYPVRVYLWEQLRQGSFPFWTERMSSGYPIYADPEAGYLNPINLLLIYLFGPFTSYKCLHYFTYLLGSACFILFIKSFIKTLGGVIVSHSIYFFSFFSLFHQQHFGITFSYLLFPCFLYFLQKLILEKKVRHLILYLSLLAHLFYFGAFQMIALIMLASLAYLIASRALTKGLFYLSIMPILIFTLAILPLTVSYLGMYTSSERTVKERLWLEGSFAPSILVNFVYPFPYRYGDSYMGVIVNREFLMHEVYIYIGISALILAILGIVFSRLDKQTNWFLISLVVVFVVLGFAKYNPLLSSIDFPITSLFRYWGRSVFLAVFALSAFAGHFIDVFTARQRTTILNKQNLYSLAILAAYMALLEFYKFPDLEVLSLLRLWKREDFRFDHLWVYMAFLLFFSLFLYLCVKKKNTTFSAFLLVLMPLSELVVFGNLALKNAFVDVNTLKTDLGYLESRYTNQRIVVTDADVIGNKTLYYKFWSPFAYTASLNREYNEVYKRIGFESTRRPSLSEGVANGFDDPVLQRNLKDLGVILLTTYQGRAYFTEPTKSLVYLKDSPLDSEIVEKYRSEQKHLFDISSSKDDVAGSYIRYDPGWKVLVNGGPVKVFKDGIFLSFAVPAGMNTVVVEYLPHTFYLGCIFTVLGTIFVMLMCFLIKKHPNLKYFLLVVIVFLILRTPYLGSDMLNSDGARWHRRSERFMQAIKSGDLASTYQHYQPGVTLMWINSATKKAIWEAQDALKLQRWSLENADDFPKIHAVSKFVLVSFLSLVLLYQMFIVSKMVGLKSSLLYGFLVSVEPFLIGIDRWFHLTSLESYFAFSAFLTYMYAITVRNRSLYFLVGSFISLSILSKLTGFVVFPLIILIEFILFYYTRDLMGFIVRSFTILLGVIATFVILFPALWVNPINVINKLIEAVIGAVDEDIRGQYFKPPFSYIYYLIILGYKLSPLTVIAFVTSCVSFIYGIVSKKFYVQGRFILSYFLTFLLILTISTKKIDRYALALVQPILLFTAIYLSKLKPKYIFLVIVAQVIFSLYTYYSYLPSTSAYYSPVFGGAKTALDIGVYENSGEYFAQVASYLNNLGRDNVYVPDNYESFKYFYRGSTAREFSPTVDYVVTSVDFDRKTPRIIPECPNLIRTFGPKFSVPSIYLYDCEN